MAWALYRLGASRAVLLPLFFAFAIVLLFAANVNATISCDVGEETCPEGENQNLCLLYNSAICDAAVFEEEDLSELTPIRQFPAKVVNWTRFPDTFEVGKKVRLDFGQLFVTVAPVVQELCRTYPKDQLALRIRQLLGLPPPAADEPPRFFVTLKVNNKRQIFRPCVDPDVTTEGPCTVEVPDKAKKKKHLVWLLRFAFDSWKIPDGFPFTRLGYTYDWNPDTSQFGVSEYVLPKGKAYRVLDKASTEEYCSSE